MTTGTIKLEQGREYDIVAYPTDSTLQGEYIGAGMLGNSRKHIFMNASEYVVVDDRWLHQDDEGRITHVSGSSTLISHFTDRMLNSAKEEVKSQLIKMLKEAGVNIT